ncbi:MAG TPA: DUF1611 domain-containing protein [Usitatibacter sp.]|nr:DUF1611 domain-containing protein [Usitatibacter sp.]
MTLLTTHHSSPAASPARSTGRSVLPRLAKAKTAYAARLLPFDLVAAVEREGRTPRAGDFVLARVERLGQHERLELATGRRAQLHAGDEIVVCYGSRYAPDQYEAYVPSDLGPCDLVAGGGLASRVQCRHHRMRAPTTLEPVGLLCDADGNALNLQHCGLPMRAPGATRVPVIAVVGTSMNSGKTTTAASLVRGFVQRGLRVGAAKVTGTGAGADKWCMVDAGASPALDFTDAGVPSTFGLAPRHVEAIFATLVANLADAEPDVIVLEVADGLFQRETAALLQSGAFREMVDAVAFAAGEAMGAKAGVAILLERGHRVIAVSGLLTASPLAMREAAQAVPVPVVSNGDIAAGVWLPDLAAVRSNERSRRAA